MINYSKKTNGFISVLVLLLTITSILRAQSILGPDLNNPAYNFSEIDKAMTQGITDSAFPGGVVLIGHKGKIVYEKAFGNFTYDKNSTPMTLDAMFDMASVSKVVGTTSMAMLLFDQGKLNLDDKVTKYFPDFAVNGKEKPILRNLLLHNSGLPPYGLFYKKLKTPVEVWDSIRHMKPEYETGSKYVYSCLGMITLQKVMEKISGTKMDLFLKENLYGPLGMNGTMYNPPAELKKKCAPTEVDNYWRKDTVQGIVHDETACLLGGVSGNAGLFSSAPDLAVFCQMILNKGFYNGKQYIKASTIDEWTKKQTSQSSRGLGWDTNEGGETAAWKKFSFTSIGHTGFTGTSLFIDKERDLFAIVLTNRVFPTRENNKLTKVRHIIHDSIIDVIDKNKESK